MRFFRFSIDNNIIIMFHIVKNPNRTERPNRREKRDLTIYKYIQNKLYVYN